MKHAIRKGLRYLAQRVASGVAPRRTKYAAELRYWQERWAAENHSFANRWYQKLMLAIAGEEDASFLEGKIVADFGCGPRNSLWWATPARIRIGIDVLADAYARFNIATHDMCYVRSTEKAIPLPSDYVDVLFTVNAMDHVMHFEKICGEILRVLAPGGWFIGSFTLDGPRTPAEPQTLSEERVRRCLLSGLKVTTRRVALHGPEGNLYAHFFDGTPPPTSGRRILWVRAAKPA
jgi:SAM-dependent methyltransferase